MTVTSESGDRTGPGTAARWPWRMVNLIYSLNGTHLFPNLTFLWFLSMKMAKTLKSVLQYCILDFHVDHFWLKNHLLNLKGNKDIGQIWMKPVFHVETQITFLALKTTKCCLNQYCFSRKVGIGWSRTKSCTGASIWSKFLIQKN